jgi:two-component system sensor histidine kinase UhpB
MTLDTALAPQPAGQSRMPRPENEERRLEALKALQILGEPLEAEFTELTKLAGHICETPIALITLIDENYQWFGAKVGVGELCGTAREVAFCAHTIMRNQLFTVQDALVDQRFAHNPLVTAPPHIRFYAGMPLVDPDGNALGTICVIDHKPRALSEQQELTLKVLAQHVQALLALRRSNQIRRRAEVDLKQAYERLDRRVVERTQELQSANERLELATSAAKIGSWEWDVNANRLRHSPQAAAQIGCTQRDMPLTGDGWKPRIHPDDLAAADQLYADYIANPKSDFECEVRVRHADGAYRWLLTRARMFFKDGEPDRMLGCSIDITDRRAMEESLRDSREQLRALAEHLRTAREEETGRIARELHDELGSALTGLRFDVEWIDRQLGRLDPNCEVDAVRARVRSVSEMIEKTIGSVRNVCRDLRPAVLDELGIGPALDWLASETEARSGIVCRVERPEAVELEPARALALFRIMQDLLTNVARHSGAKNARVILQRAAGACDLEVCDDGRGLPPDALTRRDRFGLVGLRERVLAAGGRVDFSRPSGGGTCVKVRFPGNP